jgi:hypothetical protein
VVERGGAINVLLIVVVRAGQRRQGEAESLAARSITTPTVRSIRPSAPTVAASRTRGAGRKVGARTSFSALISLTRAARSQLSSACTVG